MDHGVDQHTEQQVSEIETPMYGEVLVPCDNSQVCDFAIHRAVELAQEFGSRLVGSHVYAARLHDVRFRQLEMGLPDQYRRSDEIQRQRQVHDKLIEKGLQLISDSYLDAMERQCRAVGVEMGRTFSEGIHFEEIIREVNTHPYDLCIMGAHGMGRQPRSQLGGVVGRVMRRVDKDLLIVRSDAALHKGLYLVCIDGSAYSYRSARVALELARRFSAWVYFCGAVDLDFHHSAFDALKEVISDEASRVFRFEEQEQLHSGIVDRGLLKLCWRNLARAERMAAEYPGVRIGSRVLIGKPFYAILSHIDELEPTLLVLARHGAHHVHNAEMGSQVENLVRQAPCNVLITGTTGVRPEDVPGIEEDRSKGLEWDPLAEVRMQRVPPFAQAIARSVVEDWVRERGGTVVSSSRLNQAIENLLPTHMQFLMGLEQSEEGAEAKARAEQALSDRPVPRCPKGSDREAVRRRSRNGITWDAAAWARLERVPILARPLARSTVERFAKQRGIDHVTEGVMDENREAMVRADAFEAATMMVMFSELRARELRGEVSEIRHGAYTTSAPVARCPIKEVQERIRIDANRPPPA